MNEYGTSGPAQFITAETTQAIASGAARAVVVASQVGIVGDASIPGVPTGGDYPGDFMRVGYRLGSAKLRK